ncbi:MAG: cobaltochelatase subunit CobN [Pseudomonadota bacterium]
MHLLAAQPGGFVDDEGIIDLQQTPGDIVILSSQDTSLALLAETVETLPENSPVVRLANTIHLNKPAAFDLYEDSVLQHARLIIVSVLGGVGYWQYGVERLQHLCEVKRIGLILVPGDDHAEPELSGRSNADPECVHRIWRFLREGGVNNTRQLFNFIHHRFFDIDTPWQEPRALPECMIYGTCGELSLGEWQSALEAEKPVAMLLFYRSHVQSGNTIAFDDFVDRLSVRFNVLAVATLSLKSPSCLAQVNALLETCECSVVFNTTSFSHHSEGNASLSSHPQKSASLFVRPVCVIQTILAANDRSDWQQSDQGLRSRDIAMNIALPEYDGRIIGRAVSFKSLQRRADRTQTDIVRYELHPERADFMVELGWRWAQLYIRKNCDKRVALVLANYPTKDGRIGDGVGLDTPASAINILKSMRAAGFDADEIPATGGELIDQLQHGVTNDIDKIPLKASGHWISADAYLSWFRTLPSSVQAAVTERWGEVNHDPKYRDGAVLVSGLLLGNTFVGIQPARGFNVDLVANYHDPDLVPPHSYLAFYCWLRNHFTADAVVHVGKHGNLEWLPGKSVALSANCWPDVALGAIPNLYPFIVNDPGEGAQAKRRTHAVVLDHLMPPMARAETYGELLSLENLIDEYYQALGLDSRREAWLREKILQEIRGADLHRELAIHAEATDDEVLNSADAYLCELKESQIRHGLHVFGALPQSSKILETLVSLVRMPRGEAAEDRGILHCLSEDLELSQSDGKAFDPLDFDPASPWTGTRPELLHCVSDRVWRNCADTRERLELYAEQIIESSLSNGADLPEELKNTQVLLNHVSDVVWPALKQSVNDEIDNTVAALEGRFVPPGPSGAPTRGRLDVLPTGRNFYSLDSRAIPSQSAWVLGQKSAEAVIEKHLQEHGDFPRTLGLSVWGTATMRTGGDDIAQAFALMGVRPVWAQGSNRVVDVEVVPGFQLGRPRVDVTLRISGFFRDAFPNVARLFDTAVQTLMDYEEPGDTNTIRAHADRTKAKMIASGATEEVAQIESRYRIFGSKPGSYGAGLQGLIDERVWDSKSDLAKAYVNWGGYSYSAENFGKPAFSAFEHQLGGLQAVIQNQDNREHDLLDSDDYYQFQGGMSNTVEVLSGTQPAIYHGDHANPGKPVVRTLKEELNRVIRARVLNPKWIKAMREHGYKGAFEMAASVDYLFAYDATTGLIDDYQYERVTDALVKDEENRHFLENNNPHALREMAERLLEAEQRGMWQAADGYRESLVNTLLDLEESQEMVLPEQK